MSYGICTLPTVQAVGEKLENRDTKKCFLGSTFGFVLVLKERYFTLHPVLNGSWRLCFESCRIHEERPLRNAIIFGLILSLPSG